MKQDLYIILEVRDRDTWRTTRSIKIMLDGPLLASAVEPERLVAMHAVDMFSALKKV